MKLYLILWIAILAMVDAALGSVGGTGISDASSSWLGQESLAGTDILAGGIQPAGIGAGTSPLPSVPSLPDLEAGQKHGSYLQGDEAARQAPRIGGPAEEGSTPQVLGLFLPQMDGFTPDRSLEFVSVISPQGAVMPAGTGAPSAVQRADGSAAARWSQTAGQFPATSIIRTDAKASGVWHYPSSLASANRLYVQTSSGLDTIGGCGYGGYLPLWAEVKASGNFFFYEWYPGQSNPYVHSIGWTGKGWKKGWFGGDMPGWHILCYNSGFWSNYVYIYVYPISDSSAYSDRLPAIGSGGALPQMAPTPPNPGGEGLVMPDFNLYRPVRQTSPGYGSSAQSKGPQEVLYPGLSSSPPVGGRMEDNPAVFSALIPGSTAPGPVIADQKSSNAAATFTSSTVIASGVVSSSPYGMLFPASSAFYGNIAPAGYLGQGYKSIYPRPSVCRCNEYYVQTCPGELETVAGVFCGEWLPLWSKISRPGVYWSFEWKTCGGMGRFCSPDVRNFGEKDEGWHQTWFKGDDLGWHVLSYHSNDWSNYIYIYVWPEK